MAKRGRPTKEVTPEDRAKVAELLAAKAPLVDIAKLLGISIPTLRKYFHVELFAEKKSPPPARPARKVTDAQREKVKRYVGCRMAVEDIARAIGYEHDDELDAFKSEFAHEIKIGSAVYRAAVLDKLHEQMTGGVTGATNKLEALTQSAEPSEGAPSASRTPVGKKAAAHADAAAAISAGGKFGTRAGPKLAAVGGRRIEDNRKP